MMRPLGWVRRVKEGEQEFTCCVRRASGREGEQHPAMRKVAAPTAKALLCLPLGRRESECRVSWKQV